MDASFTLSPRKSILTNEFIPGTENNFKQLTHGVLIEGSSGVSNALIDNNIFENNLYGITLDASSYGTIQRNTISVKIIANSTPYGILSNGATGFAIQDNTINDFYPYGSIRTVGIRSNNITSSNGGDIYNNIINGTQYLMTFSGNNPSAVVNCNDMTKYNNSKRSIHIGTGSLVTQGATNQPVKNTFTGSCDNDLRAELFNEVNNSIFSYFSTSGDIDITCTYNSDIHQIPSSFQCLSKIPSPNTGIFVNLGDKFEKLGTVKSDLQSKQNLLTQGDAEALITAIQTESYGVIKNTLLAKSPYLSDRILLAYIHQHDTPPFGDIKQVIVANSPVSIQVMEAVNELNLPTGIKNQIDLAQQGISQRTIVEKDIEALSAQKLVAVDDIVKIYLDTNWIDSAVLVLEQDGTTEALCALVPVITKEDTVKTKTTLVQIGAKASAILTENPSCKKGNDLVSFCDYYEKMYKVMNRPGGIYSLSSSELNQLYTVANCSADISFKAQSTLNFLEEKIPVYPDMVFSSPKSALFEDQGEITTATNTAFSIAPNPTDNAITITMNEDLEADAIRITDIQGRVIFNTRISNPTVYFEFNQYQQGIYLVQLLKSGVPINTSKVVVRK